MAPSLGLGAVHYLQCSLRSLVQSSHRHGCISDRCGADRPNQIGDPRNVHSTLNKWFNTSAYSINAPGTYGTAGRSSLQGPGRYSVDLALFRNFTFEFAQKSQYIGFRIEAFNATNHPTFANPNATFTSANFGRIITANDPRIMQVALKYVF